jgi:hypothetical protein
MKGTDKIVKKLSSRACNSLVSGKDLVLCRIRLFESVVNRERESQTDVCVLPSLPFSEKILLATHVVYNSVYAANKQEPLE